jgi:S1-C subfamily serine protease
MEVFMLGPERNMSVAAEPFAPVASPFAPEPAFAPLSPAVSSSAFAPLTGAPEAELAPEEGEVGAPWTGMWVMRGTEETDPTVFVRPCAPGSPAEKAGLAGGDEILAVDDDSALGPDGYALCFASYMDREEGDVMRFDVLRRGVPLSLFLVVERRPEGEEGG